MDARRWAAAGTVVGALALAGVGASCSSGADPEDTEQQQDSEQQDSEQQDAEQQDQEQEQEQESDAE